MCGRRTLSPPDPSFHLDLEQYALQIHRGSVRVQVNCLSGVCLVTPAEIFTPPRLVSPPSNIAHHCRAVFFARFFAAICWTGLFPTQQVCSRARQPLGKRVVS